MTHACDDADKHALSGIAEILLAECETLSGEAKDGRIRLVQNINTKLLRLRAPAVTVAAQEPHESAEALISRGIENDDLCAHTRNFLQMALSRLERFDMAWTAKLSPAAAAQVNASMTQQPQAQ